MNQLRVSDIKMFVPAKDFDESLRFYKALGWTENWRDEDDSLALLELAGSRFYLQDFYVKQLAENYMIHVTVDDAAAWARHVEAAIKDGGFSSARVSAPRAEPYGALVTFVHDPSGVLLHFAQFVEG